MNKLTLSSLLLLGLLNSPKLFAQSMPESKGFSFLSNNKTEGDCSPIITGSIDTLKLTCVKSAIPEAALKSLEGSLKEVVATRMKQMRTPEKGNVPLDLKVVTVNEFSNDFIV